MVKYFTPPAAGGEPKILRSESSPGFEVVPTRNLKFENYKLSQCPRGGSGSSNRGIADKGSWLLALLRWLTNCVPASSRTSHQLPPRK